MNTIRRHALVLVAAALSLGTAAFGAKPADSTAALQLQVDMPFVQDLFIETDVRDALTNQVTQSFVRKGYSHGIEAISPGRTASKDRPVLSVHLIRWERTRTGFIDCTFTATLTQPDGTSKSLGIFNGTEVALNPRSRWDLARGFADAAQEAAERLWTAMQKQSLLPDPDGPAVEGPSPELTVD